MYEWYVAGLILAGTVIGLMALSLPVAFAFLLANFIGLMLFIGIGAALNQLVANATTSMTNSSFVTVPLFILMGELFFHTGIATRVFDVIDKFLGNIRGRLSYLTIAGGTVFAALSGSSMANTAMLGSTLLPDMQKRGYNDKVSMGTIIATGGLAILIPPSALAVLLGSLARIDIAQLLLASTIPALVLAALYALTVFIIVRLDPDAAPSYTAEKTDWGTKIRLAITNLLPMGFVVFMVIGLIVLGIATPTESAAFGVVGVLVVAGFFRALTFESMYKSLYGAARVSGMVFLIILGSTTFSELLAISGTTAGLIEWTTTLGTSPYTILVFMILIVILMGMFMEPVSIMMLIVPFFFPLASALGFDLIWFGVIVLISIELGLATPPFGLGLFVMMGVAPKGTTLPQVSLAAAPYALMTVVLIGLLILFPGMTSVIR